MLRQTTLLLLATAALGLVVTACSGEEAPAEGLDTTNPEAPVNATLAAMPTIEAGVQPTAGMISSGAAERPTDLPVPQRPTPETGVRSAIHINEALRVLPFTPLEPVALREGFHLDASQLLENPEGQSLPGLPRLRMIYQGDPVGVIIVLQGPATGEQAEGEAVQIGAHQAWLTQSRTTMLTWEQDGLRIEMRGNDISREKLLEVAASMAPFEAPAQ